MRYNLCELPSSRSAARTLSKDTSFFWEERPLRDGLQELSATHHISIWLDRRIDPTQAVTFRVTARASDRSLRTALRQLAASLPADAALVENVVYIGPRDKVARIQRAAVQLHDTLSRTQEEKGDEASRNAGPRVELRPLAWPELSTPTDVLASVAQQWNVQIDAELPHDLFHAGQLQQPCTLATQLALVCGGFDREAKWRGPGRFDLVALQEGDAWQCVYDRRTIPAPMLQPTNRAKLMRQYPGSRFRQQGDRCLVIGPTQLHLALLQPVQPKARRADSLESQRWTFEVRNKPAKAVMDNLVASLGLKAEWHADCKPGDLQRLVSFEVTNATVDELLAALAGAGELSIEREAFSVSIKPTEP